MRIVINARFLRSRYENSYGHFQYQTLKRVVNNHPQDIFIFLFDRPVPGEMPFGPNVTFVYSKPAAKGPLSWKWWFDIKIPALLRKYKADVFVSMEGILSMRTQVPQCLVLQDFSFLHTPDLFKKSHLSFYKKNTPLYLNKASTIAVVSDAIKRDIENYSKTIAGKVTILPGGAEDAFCPVSGHGKEVIKEKYTGGCNYFICTGFLDKSSNLITLLKAFSVFKKRQKSSWKLVLAGTFYMAYQQEFLKSLASYKYRDDVIVLAGIDENERAALLGAAYALVYPKKYEGFAIPVAEAMRSNVPVIVSSDLSVKSIAGDAALYTDVSDPADIADKIMQLYKDEALRSRLVVKGAEKAAAYHWNTTADLLWQAIRNAAG